MAPPTLFLFVMLAFGLLSLCPTRGVVGIVTSKSLSGTTARHLLSFVIPVPVGLGWMLSYLTQKGLLSQRLAAALSVLMIIILLMILASPREHNFGDIIGGSSAMRKVMQQIELVAPTGAAVLVTGESGTGKELVARAIHDHSPREGRALIKVNCSAVPDSLFESEFFGHVKGAFTGALKDKLGRSN